MPRGKHSSAALGLPPGFRILCTAAKLVSEQFLRATRTSSSMAIANTLGSVGRLVRLDLVDVAAAVAAVVASARGLGDAAVAEARVVGLSRVRLTSGGVTARLLCRRWRRSLSQGLVHLTLATSGVPILAGAAALLHACPSAGGTPRGRRGTLSGHSLGSSRRDLAAPDPEVPVLVPLRSSGAVTFTTLSSSRVRQTIGEPAAPPILGLLLLRSIRIFFPLFLLLPVKARLLTD